jgi:hypothetical protein
MTHGPSPRNGGPIADFFWLPNYSITNKRLNAVDRLSFDEIYHLGSRARAFLGNSCGIVFYRLTPTEIA